MDLHDPPKNGDRGTGPSFRIAGRPTDQTYARFADGPHLPAAFERLVQRLPEKIIRRSNIDRLLTFHIARHTFATTVTLAQGMPIETVSKLLGHKDIRTTQIYAAVTHDQPSRELSICPAESTRSARSAAAHPDDARHAADTLSNARFGEGLRLKNTNIIYESACYDP